MKPTLLYKKTTAVFAALILSLICVCSVSAAEKSVCGVVSYSVGGYDGDESDIFAPDEAVGIDDLGDFSGIPSKLLLDMRSGTWGFDGWVQSARGVTLDGISTAIAYMPDIDDTYSDDSESGMVITEDYDDMREVGGVTFRIDVSEFNADISSYAELCFGVEIIGGDGTYEIISEIETDKGIFRSVTYACTDEYTLVHVDISDARGLIEAVRVNIGFDEENMPVAVKVTSPYATSDVSAGMISAEKLSTDKLSASIGSVAARIGRVKPADGFANIEGNLAVAERPETGSSAYFEIVLSGVKSGNMTLGVVYKNSGNFQSDNGQVVFSQKISLVSPDGVYTIPVEVRDDIVSYVLQFDNIECDTYFTINSVKLFCGAVNYSAEDNLIGAVQSISRDGNSVTFSGIMEREAASKYSGKKIGFYAIAGNAVTDLMSSVPIGDVKVSTRFEYTADISKYAADADTFMFFAAVIVSDDEIVPISNPRYCDAPSAPDENVSNMGLYGGAAVGAFESNMSHVMVDVPLDELLENEDNGVSASYLVYGNLNEDGSQEVDNVSFSRKILDRLDTDVNFYISAGIRVYLRFTASEPIGGMTYTDSSDEFNDYAIDTENAHSRQMYAAVVRFLASRYRDVDGFVIGKGVNDSKMFGGVDITDAASYAYYLADLCRITYNAACVSNPDAIIIIPFVEQDRAEGNVISDRTLAVMLSDTFSHIGNIPCAFMYSFDEAEDNLDFLSALERLMTDLKINGPDSFMCLYEPTAEYLNSKYRNYINTFDNDAIENGGEEKLGFIEYTAEQFGDICGICAEYKARAVFISVDNLSLANNHEFYSSLKNVGDSDRFVYDSVARVSDGESENKYTIWDFTDKYYPLDWIAVGENSSCAADYSEIFSLNDGFVSRALRSGFISDGSSLGGAGITLCNFRQSVDFTDISELEFRFAVDSVSDSDDEQDISVVFLIGNTDYRAEYCADVSVDKVYRMTCDLSGYNYRNEVDYVGVIVYSTSDVYLEISSVSAVSDTLTSDGIGAIFESYEENDEYKANYKAVVAFAVIVAVFSLCVCVLLIRRDREEAEEVMRKHSRNGVRDYERKQQK